MVSAELVAKFKALGVDLERVGDVAEALVHLFDGVRLAPIERVAVVRLVEQAVQYAEDETEGPAFRARCELLYRVLAEGDREVVAGIEAEPS